MNAPKVYAQVLVDVAEKDLEGVLTDLKRFKELFTQNALMYKVFNNPTLLESEKSGLIEAFSKKLDVRPLSVRFLKLLSSRNRMDLMDQIFKEVDFIRLEKEGGVAGEIVSAVPLATDQVVEIAKALSKKMNKPVYLQSRVDTGVIAGMRVTLAGTTYDGTVQNKLEQLVGKFN